MHAVVQFRSIPTHRCKTRHIMAAICALQTCATIEMPMVAIVVALHRVISPPLRQQLFPLLCPLLCQLTLLI